ncbi:sigma-54-dependent transcriptional regulator [Paenibacillus sp. GCM10023248]|uniref:sigma-54-dependent transcriptional regulator n=1 Tax=unclassified Paenibacillus TaxID=185978 RepID=UPI002379878C|nr:sigma-54 dependent transcriptional regulator [Paenibacillus sp. MAHUQ-63]MDD9265501.1 sigma-54 dependent transcriptional regulator [Paenibacillus sp. MAHUQ-63]
MTHRILVVDDEVKLCRNIAIKLERCGYQVDTAQDGKTAIGLIERLTYGAVILDYMLTDMTGLDVLQAIKQKHPYLLVFMLTAYGNVENAVMAMKLGAADYFNKPIELKVLAEKIQTVLPLTDTEEFTGTMAFVSDRMKQIREMLERVNQTDASILLLGESGVGKTALAKWVHQMSHRHQHPFISLNCAAIPENLLESELFGYEKGAFTGAIDTRIGKFEAANQGTIFLDEIGEMSLATQAKLLHVIEEKRIIRLGSHQERQVDVRIIAATNRNIQDFVRSGKFREDLYYRLNLVEIVLPPLRERKEDIKMLIQLKLKDLNLKYGKSVTASDELKKMLETLPWQGNIRELFNVLERMHIMKTTGHLHIGDLPPNLSDSIETKPVESPAGKLQDVLEEVEEKMIEDALLRVKGNQTKAADLLGISRNTLIHKMKKIKR